MAGRDLKADAVRAGVALYKVAAEAGINTARLSRLLNGRELLTDQDHARITDAIDRLAERDLAGAR